MNKLTKRIILGLLLVLVLSGLFIIPTAFAVDNYPDVVVECQNEPIDERYTINVKTVFDDDAKVTGFEIEAFKNNELDKTDVDFELVQISDIELKDNSIKFHAGTSSNPTIVDMSNYPNVKSYFKENTAPTNDKEKAKKEQDDANKYFAIFKFVTIAGSNANVSKCDLGQTVEVKTSVGELDGPEIKKISESKQVDLPKVKKGHAIDKTKVPTNDFDKLIYYAYDSALKEQSFVNGTTYYNKNLGNNSEWHVPDSNKIELLCDFNHKFKPEELKFGNYYKNVKWMYATTSFKIKGGDYIYHPYNNENSVTVAGDTCEVTCEEGVKIEYGPPVASKAGLCFEYKVRATSHVNCYAETDINSSIKDVDLVCEPMPYCSHDVGVVTDRAGPNEDFAACINECDGGKYTSKCSKKCYTKVYGKSNNDISTRFLNDYVDKIGMADSCADQFGCYYLDNNNKIQWAGKKTVSGAHNLANWFTDDEFGDYYFARYYTNMRPKNLGGDGKYTSVVFDRVSEHLGHGPAYMSQADGFARMVFEDSSLCDSKCVWLGCTNPVKYENGKPVGINYYLNQYDKYKKEDGTYSSLEIHKDDYDKNLEIYQSLVDQCSAAAKCSTQHVEFEMSVDYETGEQTKTISFPYDSSKPNATHATEKDKLCSNNKKGGQSCTSTINNGNTIIIYDSNATPAPQNKPTNAKEMHYYENPAGCYNSANIDLNSNDGDDTKNRLYRSTISFPGAWINFKTGEITYKPVTDVEHWQSIEDKFCIPREAKDVNTKYWLYYQNKTICNKTQSSINKSDIEKWNIRANIIGFGLYNWNINVKCFYALDEKDNKCTDDVEYRIRSINLDDMFPNQEGEARNATNSTGRDPGFNWSSAATITSSKNAYYNSNPSTLINKIQNVGYGIYSDKYLDYEFNLDTNTLREMRNQINNGNYTDFDESGFHKSERAGIGYYYSTKIRNLGNNNKTPGPEIIEQVCNNLELSDDGRTYLNNCGVTNGESE